MEEQKIPDRLQKVLIQYRQKRDGIRDAQIVATAAESHARQDLRSIVSQIEGNALLGQVVITLEMSKKFHESMYSVYSAKYTETLKERLPADFQIETHTCICGTFRITWK